MSSDPQGWTTASVNAIAKVSSGDPTPGLVLVYSKLHAHLPSALPFRTSETTLGRDSSNSLALPEAAVSRHHAAIDRRGDSFWIRDLGSTNGTWVGGQQINECPLAEHDVVRVGDSIFRVALQGVHQYSAYRLDGSIVDGLRRFAHPPSATLIGGCQIDALLERLGKVAGTRLGVVITGESGTGKELVARELHQQSGRQGPFQAINCAALPSTLLESALFGHRRGAFTGAIADKTGLVQAAHRGTLFLDEIGDMVLEAQAKLLRVLQEREVLPLGATSPESVDVRVVCATHRDLDEMVASGSFRGDLLARLREFHVHLPPLRERLEDIYRLVCHFRDASGAPEATVEFPYMLALAHYRWPYNVRELESAVRLSIALGPGPSLQLEHLPEPIQAAVEDEDSARSQAARSPAQAAQPRPAGTPSEDELREHLSQYGGNIAAVGRVYGKERMQVHRWLKRYGIDPNEYR